MIAEIRIVGTEYWVYYRNDVISKQRSLLKAAQKLASYIKGLG